jgi:hypothetical protein
MSTVEVSKQPTRYTTVTQKKNVSVVTEPTEQVLEIHDPGVAGPPNVLAVGTVTTGNTPEVTITGIAPSQTLNFVIPTGGTYAHTQYSASNRWEIVHNLNYKPNVTVVDSAGTIIEGAIEYTGPNSIVLLFSASFAGTAYLS